MPPVTAISLPEKALIYCGITRHTENAFLVFMQSLLMLMLLGMKLPLDVRHLVAAGDSLHHRTFKATLCDTHVFTWNTKYDTANKWPVYVAQAPFTSHCIAGLTGPRWRWYQIISLRQQWAYTVLFL